MPSIVVETGGRDEDGRYMPHAVTVWAVALRPGDLQERRGTLELEPDDLLFTAADGSAPVRIPLRDIRRVRRLRGSPVLVVAHQTEGGKDRTAFYFAQPPPLEPVRTEETELHPSLFGSTRSSKRKARRQNAAYLGTWNREMKEDIRDWERAIKRAIEGRR
jgi:hypothetical protein